MSNQIELRHLRYFVAVAEERHFRKASERLYISQPGLSRQIKQMEDFLGVQLLERDKKQVSLTPAGAYLQQEATHLLGQLSQTWPHLRALQEGRKGDVRMGFVGSAMQTVIPDLLVRMNQTYPGINFSLEEIAINQQMQALQEGTLDIGFVRIDRAPTGMRMVPVMSDHFSLVLPVNHPIDAANFHDMRQLAQEHFILFSSSYSPTYYDTIMSICEDWGFHPQVSHKSVHANTIFRLVECGLGVSIIPNAFRQGFQLAVKFVELLDIPQRTVLSAIWREDHRNPALAKVVEMLEEGMEE